MAAKEVIYAAVLHDIGKWKEYRMGKNMLPIVPSWPEDYYPGIVYPSGNRNNLPGYL
jgi:hypothetical protein